MSNITKENLRFLSIKNCNQIGKGVFSKVYLLDDKTIVKVINDKMPFEDVLYEYEMSKKAYENGIPCPKTFEIVKTENGYGIVYERVVGKTLNKYLKKHPKMYAIYAKKYAELLKKINNICVNKAEVEGIKKIYLDRIDNYAKYGLTQQQFDFLKQVINLVPEQNNLLHGDPRLTNVMITEDGELVFIDLDNLSYGNPIFDVCAVCYTLCVMAKRHPPFVKIANGIGYKKSLKFWQIFLQNYYDTNNLQQLSQIEKVCEILARLREITYLNRPKGKLGVFVDAYVHLVKDKFFKNKQETIKLISKMKEN